MPGLPNEPVYDTESGFRRCQAGGPKAPMLMWRFPQRHSARRKQSCRRWSPSLCRCGAAGALSSRPGCMMHSPAGGLQRRPNRRLPIQKPPWWSQSCQKAAPIHEVPVPSVLPAHADWEFCHEPRDRDTNEAFFRSRLQKSRCRDCPTNR